MLFGTRAVRYNLADMPRTCYFCLTVACYATANVLGGLQVKVQEPGGPEEMYHVTCKWAATVDIKALTQFVA